MATGETGTAEGQSNVTDVLIIICCCHEWAEAFDGIKESPIKLGNKDLLSHSLRYLIGESKTETLELISVSWYSGEIYRIIS